MNKSSLSGKSVEKPNKQGLHPRNIHRQDYDFPSLIHSDPRLAPHVKKNVYGNPSIDFADPLAVKLLNAALLKHHYGIDRWDLPDGALCPPVPGRVDYIHYLAELLELEKAATSRRAARTKTTLLDIGTGANGIYPLLACKVYGWHCVGSDINTQSLENVASIINNNPVLKERLVLRHQPNKHHIFEGIIQAGEYYDVTVCNPPFHASQDEAVKSAQRKLSNLFRNRQKQGTVRRDIGVSSEKGMAVPAGLNFGGWEAELWCKGGEIMFLKKLMKESRVFADQCHWFSSLVSKADNVKPAKKLLRKLGATDVRKIEMVQGNKVTRVVAWTFV